MAVDDWGAEESELWDQIAGEREGDYGDFLANDPTAQALFNEGWISEDPAGDARLMRDAFFDYCIEEGYFDDPAEFDWEAWREYMGYEDG